MSQPFRFKYFNVIQNVNPQKVGTDSMLLGAWCSQGFKSILDIGTGTGILALMMAQKNPEAMIYAIEPDLKSLNEAEFNFTNSEYASQIRSFCTSLQEFKTDVKFDLIISNPPYFENSTLSADILKNQARHTLNLPVDELYRCTADLLSDAGILVLIFPNDLEDVHFSAAKKHLLYPSKILRTKKENGEFRRTLVSFSFKNELESSSEMIVKYGDNRYSDEYIELTREFYNTNLKTKK